MTSQEYYEKYREKLSSQDSKIIMEAFYDLSIELVKEAGDKADQNNRKNKARGISIEKAFESYLRDAAVKFENINNLLSPPVFKKDAFKYLMQLAEQKGRESK